MAMARRLYLLPLARVWVDHVVVEQAALSVQAYDLAARA